MSFERSVRTRKFHFSRQSIPRTRPATESASTPIIRLAMLVNTVKDRLDKF